jgi:hypothetical protein
MVPMAKKSAAARKTLTSSNLIELGADRLAGLLIEATAGDANLKRRLRLELAGEVGAADLALEIDKRLNALAASRTKVSWRKRPDLLADLDMHRAAIVDRLAAAEPRLGFDRLVAWFDLYPGLISRVKDPKGELSGLFFDAAADLAAVASATGPDAAPILFEALQTRLSEWGGWIGRAAPDLSETLAGDLLKRLTEGRARPTGRLALVVRKLADRAGDVEAWAAAIPDLEKTKPEVGAEIARRMAAAGRVEDAREALEAARPRAPTLARFTTRSRAPEPPPPSDAWDAAEIIVLEAEGTEDEAQDRRWTLFERTLSDVPLKAFIARLADFDDVEALDRAHAVAAHWPDAARGLAFLMNWPALREAAEMVLARSQDLRLDAEETALWAARLEGRYPNAALLLIRARARHLTRQGLGGSEEVRALSAEARALTEIPGALETVASHADFIDELEALSRPVGRAAWR